MDAFLVLACFVVLIIAFWRIVWWRWVWIVATACLAVAEAASKLITGDSLSEQFWGWSLAHPSQGWLLIGLVALGGLALAWHLAAKLRKRRTP